MVSPLLPEEGMSAKPTGVVKCSADHPGLRPPLLSASFVSGRRGKTEFPVEGMSAKPTGMVV
jgi:hypothetical protein